MLINIGISVNGDVFRIKDPIYGHVTIYRGWEEKVINSYVFQRLRHIKQLQLTYLVYPGANHTRFEHSLGAGYLAELFARHVVDKLQRNYERYKGSSVYRDTYNVICRNDDFKRVAILATRMAGLLHDIGHTVLGHYYDSSIVERLLAQKGRTKEDLYRVIGGKIDFHEYVGYLIYKHLLRERIRGDVERIYGKTLADTYIGLLDIMMVPIGPGNTLLDKELKKQDPYDKLKPAGLLLRMLVRDWIYPADILDFLMRDSYYTGVESLGKIDYQRLIEKTVPLPVSDKNTLVLAVEKGAIPNLERLLAARILMYENVYLHPVVDAFNRELDIVFNDPYVLQSVFDADPTLLLSGDAESVQSYLYQHLRLTDDVLYTRLIELCRPSGDFSRCENKDLEKDVREALEHLLLNRKARWKLVYSEKIYYPPYLSGPGNTPAYRRDIEAFIKNSIIDGQSIESSEILVTVNKISFIPPSFGLIHGSLIYVAIKTGESYTLKYYNLESFAELYRQYNVGIIRIYGLRRSRRWDVLRNVVLERSRLLMEKLENTIIEPGRHGEEEPVQRLNDMLREYIGVVEVMQATH